jgi:hypothetical protein
MDRAPAWRTARRGGATRGCAILVGRRHRRGIAHSLRRAVADARRPAGQTARVPVEPAIARASADDVHRVADVLADRLRAVTPRAVALAEELITDPGSPVYRNGTSTVRALEERLRVILFELEGSLHA